MAQVTAVNISEKKGVRKHEVPYIDVKCRHGIVGDATLVTGTARSAFWRRRAWTKCAEPV